LAAVEATALKRQLDNTDPTVDVDLTEKNKKKMAVPVPPTVIANPEIAASADDESMATNISLKTASSSKVERVQPALVAAHTGDPLPLRRSTRKRNARKKRNALDSNPVENVKRVKGARGESSKVDDEGDDAGDDEWRNLDNEGDDAGDDEEPSTGDEVFEQVVEATELKSL